MLDSRSNGSNLEANPEVSCQLNGKKSRVATRNFIGQESGVKMRHNRHVIQSNIA